MTPDTATLTYLRDQGYTVHEAAAALGMHHPQLQRWLDALGVQWQYPRCHREHAGYCQGVYRLGITVAEWQTIRRAVDRYEQYTGSRDAAIAQVAYRQRLPRGAVAAFDAGYWMQLD